MIPVRDVVPTRTAPWATIGLAVGQALAVHDLGLGAALLHGAANVACLWNFGNTLEDRMGHARFLVFYGLCGGLAALVHALTGAAAPAVLVGASGGVAGLVGAYFVLYPDSRLITLVPVPFSLRAVEVPAVVLPCGWFLLQFAFQVGTTAVAGLAVGALVVRLFRRPERMRVEWWNEI